MSFLNYKVLTGVPNCCKISLFLQERTKSSWSLRLFIPLSKDKKKITHPVQCTNCTNQYNASHTTIIIKLYKKNQTLIYKVHTEQEPIVYSLFCSNWQVMQPFFLLFWMQLLFINKHTSTSTKCMKRWSE
jgi:hypothetical protein